MQKWPIPRLEAKITVVVMAGAGLLATYAFLHILKPGWPPTACSSKDCVQGREWMSAFVGFLVLLGGLYQYRRNQLWKRAEFVAGEMKDFRTEPLVVTAMTMIDWTSRRLDLLKTNSPDPEKWVAVTRRLQNRALWPHKLLGGDDGYYAQDSETEAEMDPAKNSYEEKDSGLAGYTRAQVAIRDAYDAFLDGLERLANFRENALVTISDLRPYLGYWIGDIANPTDNQADNEWTFWLLSYLHFYGYVGVAHLFLEFGYDIGIKSERYRYFMGEVADQATALRVRDLIVIAQCHLKD